MIRSLVALSDRVSRSLRAWLLALAAVVTVFLFMLLVLEPLLIGETGHRVIDIQPELSAAQIAEQVPLYTPRAVLYAWVFYVFDFVFPFLASLLATGLMAFGLRQFWPAAYVARRFTPLVLLPYLSALGDWLENVFTLWLLTAYPPVNDSALQGLMAARTFKGVAGAVVMTPVLLVFVVGLVVYIWRRRKARAGVA